MSESTEQRCGHCGAALLPGKRFCVACLTQIPGSKRPPRDQMTELMRQIPSTHRPDKTMVFIPELREARLKRERRNRRAVISVVVSCAILAIVAFSIRRINERKQTQAESRKREVMARNELDLYSKALENFRADFGRYPVAIEGLAALVRQPSTLAGWRGPYIEKDYSVDPWGSDYNYQAYNEGAGYILSSYGPEGEAAGRPFLQVHSGSNPLSTSQPSRQP